MANLINPDKLNFHSDGLPIPVQIYKEIRRQIVSEELKPGTRLPSAQEFCRQLQLSKATIGRAFELLKSDGYIQTLVGSGAFVRGGIQKKEPATVLDFSVNTSTTPVPLSDAAKALLHSDDLNHSSQASRLNIDQRARQVALGYWNRAHARVMENLELCDASLIEAREKSLRCEVAKRLSETRGVLCRSAQVIPVASRRVALDLIARLHVGAGDLVAMHTQEATSLRSTLINQGNEIFDLPSDFSENLCSNLPEHVWQKISMMYLTPSCGSPNGSSMTVKDKSELLSELIAHQKLLVEDDVLVEYSAPGLATRSLQGMAAKLGAPVIYVNSVEPIFLEICQAAFLVVPLDISGLYRKAVQQLGLGLSALDTLVLSHMFVSGEYEMLAIRTRNDALHKQSLLIKLVEKLMPYATVSTAEMLGPRVNVTLENDLKQESFLKTCQEWHFKIEELTSTSNDSSRAIRKKFQLTCNAQSTSIYLAGGEQEALLDHAEAIVAQDELTIAPVHITPAIQISLLPV